MIGLSGRPSAILHLMLGYMVGDGDTRDQTKNPTVVVDVNTGRTKLPRTTFTVANRFRPQPYSQESRKALRLGSSIWLGLFGQSIRIPTSKKPQDILCSMHGIHPFCQVTHRCAMISTVSARKRYSSFRSFRIITRAHFPKHATNFTL